jgi:serine/threonine protein kinase
MGEVLGEGQCGKVYRSTERSNGAHWAIKVLKLKQFALSSTTADLLREADIMKQLAGHPNVISLKDVFQTSDALFFVMELVP